MKRPSALSLFAISFQAVPFSLCLAPNRFSSIVTLANSSSSRDVNLDNWPLHVGCLEGGTGGAVAWPVKLCATGGVEDGTVAVNWGGLWGGKNGRAGPMLRARRPVLGMGGSYECSRSMN